MTGESHSGLLTAIKMMLAGLIAFSFSQIVSWPFSFWAVITVAAVTRPGLKNTYLKGAARFLGTFVGLILAFLSLQLSNDNMYVLSLCLFFIIFITTVVSFLTSFISNCGLIIGITVVVVLAAGESSAASNTIIFLRFVDVSVGIVSVLMVNILLRDFFYKNAKLKKNVSTALIPQPQKPLFIFNKKSHILLTALTIGAISSISFILWLYFKYPGGYWLTISCLIIMEDNLQTLREKMTLRFMAHLFACVIGGISVYLIGQQSWLMGIPILLTFFICGYIMVKDNILGKAANTLAVAVCIMLLIEPSEILILNTILERFLNTIAGIAIGFLGSWFFLLPHSRVIKKIE